MPNTTHRFRVFSEILMNALPSVLCAQTHHKAASFGLPTKMVLMVRDFVAARSIYAGRGKFTASTMPTNDDEDDDDTTQRPTRKTSGTSSCNCCS